MNDRNQKVVLNVQHSTWAAVEAEILKSSTLEPLLIIQSFSKLFADDASLFSVVRDKDLTTRNLNGEMKKINNWVFVWKTNFNPDPNKQAREVIFLSRLQNNSTLH